MQTLKKMQTASLSFLERNWEFSIRHSALIDV
jgi:hypothetical protein